MQRAAVDGRAARLVDPDPDPESDPNRNRTIDRPRVASETPWTSIQPEVRNSCSLALRRIGNGIRSIAVTSTTRREGRTTVALGLAAAASTELGYRTILLDLDLERRTIQNMTSVGPGPGVIEFLYEEAPIEDCLQRVDQHVEVMTAGVLLAPVTLTGRMARLADLIHQVGDRCDVMIADLPPMSHGITVARVTDLFDSVSLVVRAGRASVAHIEQSASILTQRPFMILTGTGATRTFAIRKFLGPRP